MERLLLKSQNEAEFFMAVTTTQNVILYHGQSQAMKNAHIVVRFYTRKEEKHQSFTVLQRAVVSQKFTRKNKAYEYKGNRSRPCRL
jgi:hypothetical protein